MLVLNVSSFLVVAVEGNEHLDLNGFDHRVHSGVLLDGVGDAFFLRQHREVLQGRAKKCTEGQSATNVYAYPFTLARRAVIATFDLSAKNLQAFAHHHWLSDQRNVVVLELVALPTRRRQRLRAAKGAQSPEAHRRTLHKSAAGQLVLLRALLCQRCRCCRDEVPIRGKNGRTKIERARARTFTHNTQARTGTSLPPLTRPPRQHLPLASCHHNLHKTFVTPMRQSCPSSTVIPAP